MFPAIHHRRLWAPLALSAEELQRLREAGEQLRDAGRAGAGTSALRARQVALICDLPLPPATRALARAVADTGGTVTLLQAGAWRAKPPEAMRDAARVLGRLYDAIDCCDLPRTVVEQIEREAGVPVLDGLAGAGHPLRGLAAGWADEPAAELELALPMSVGSRGPQAASAPHARLACPREECETAVLLAAYLAALS